MLHHMLSPDLLSWQRRTYGGAHAHRTNLLVHALTVPVFVSGIALEAFAIGALDGRALLAGTFAMTLAMLAQGRGHRLEARAPAPFRSPLDVVARIFAEQLVTFPRFVLSGDFARAWRESAPSRARAGK
jgi:hypothetical protein